MLTESPQFDSRMCPDSQQETLRCALFTPKWPATTASNGIVTYVSVLNDQLRLDGHRPVVVTKANGSTAVGAANEEIAQWSPRYGLMSRMGDRLTRLLSQDDSQRRCKQAGQGIADALIQASGEHPISLLEMEESFGLPHYVAQCVEFPVVVRLHGPWFLNGQANGVKQDRHFANRVKAEGKAIAAASAVTACCENVLEATRSYYNLELPHATVIPNPSPVHAREERWAAERAEPNTILFVGRFDRHKGGDTMLLAFQDVAERFPDSQLVFVGPDPGLRSGTDDVINFPEFVATHLEKSVARRINYLGKQEPAVVETWRRRAAVTVIPSSFDNFPYSALESVACGCPVVATRVGGIPEIVRDGETGLLVPPDDPTALADGIGRMLADRDFAARLGAAAAVDAEQRFHPRKVAEQTVAFYRDVIAKWKARR